MIFYKIERAAVGQMRLRTLVGFGAAICAVLFAAWLPLGVMDIIPFVFEVPGESYLRSHAGLAVGSLMVAAWGFWDYN